jgi:hypothetical protein
MGGAPTSTTATAAPPEAEEERTLGPWECDATAALRFRVVRAEADLDDEGALSFEPEFTHQVFGDEEVIYCYKGLRVRAPPPPIGALARPCARGECPHVEATVCQGLCSRGHVSPCRAVLPCLSGIFPRSSAGALCSGQGLHAQWKRHKTRCRSPDVPINAASSFAPTVRAEDAEAARWAGARR